MLTARPGNSSRVFRDAGKLIGQILASAAMLPPGPGGRRWLPAEVDAPVDVGRPPSVEEAPRERDAAALDHAPATVRFVC